jgi:AraC-like DNA-binding protein
MKNSVIGPLLVAVYQALQSYGVDADAILAGAGISMDQVNNPSSRIDLNTNLSLLSAVAEHPDIDNFGLRFADHVLPTTFNALGLALISSSSLRSFCVRWQRYYSFVSTLGSPVFIESEDMPVMTFGEQPWVDKDSAVRQIGRVGIMATFVKYIRFMHGPDFLPEKVELAWPHPGDDLALYYQYFGPKITFMAPRDAIYLDPDELNIPMPASNSALARENEKIVIMLQAKWRHADIVARTQALLVELMPTGDCSKTRVAAGLNISTRTLHNKLTMDGTSFQKILNETRHQMARQYLQQMMSVKEIAYLLGFSDCSNFSRAFYRWSGQSPSEFRDGGQSPG